MRIPPSGFVSNPAWATHAIADAYDLLQDRVPPSWLPKLEDARPGVRGTMAAEMHEFGCGVFGCVLPTLDPRVVLKATTDQSEADFAARYAGELAAPICVAYHMVISLAARHQGNPIYLLWRESAADVGRLGVTMGGVERGSPGYEAELVIHEQHQIADALLRQLASGKSLGRRDLVAWKDAVLEMGRAVPALDFLARGMVKVLDQQGIAILDVHGGNIGRCQRGDRMEWVITDPGHVVTLGGGEGSSPRKNPPTPRSRDAAFAEVARLFADPDPASLEIIMDIAREHDPNALDFLVDFSEQQEPMRDPEAGDYGRFNLGEVGLRGETSIAWHVTFTTGYLTTVFIDWNGKQWSREMYWSWTSGGRISQSRRAVALELAVIAMIRQHPNTAKLAVQQALFDKVVATFKPRKALAAAESPRADGEIRYGDLIIATRNTEDPVDLNAGERGEITSVAPRGVSVFFPTADTDVSIMRWPHPDFRILPP